MVRTVHAVARLWSCSRAMFSSKMRIYWVIIVLVLVTRLPMLNRGFGLDGDSYILANTAQTIAESHSYVSSRMPGYPFFELISSIFIGLGPIGTNGLVMFFSIGASLAFIKFCELTKTTNLYLLSIAFALFPLSVVNGSCTMDYMVAVFFALLAYVFAWEGRVAPSGISMGLAGATRLTSGLLLLPLLIYFYRRKGRGDAVLFLGVTSFVTLIFFSIVVRTYGFGFLLAPSGLEESEGFFRGLYLIMTFFGALPSILFVLYVAADSRKIAVHLTESLKSIKAETVTVVFALLIGIASFFFYPNQPEYLLITLPFALILLPRIVVRRKFVVLICILVIATGFINVRIARLDLIDCEGEIAPGVSDGYIIHDFVDRGHQIENLKSLYGTNLTHSVIVVSVTEAPFMSDYYREKYGFTLEPEGSHPWNFVDTHRDIIFAAYLSESNLYGYITRGYSIYYTPFANYLNYMEYGYKISSIENTSLIEIQQVTYPYL